MKKTILFLVMGIFSLNAAHIGFLMPSGAHRGTTVDIIVGGQAFWGVNGVIVSGGGVEAEFVKVVRSLPLPDGSQRRYITGILKHFHKLTNKLPQMPEKTDSWRKHEYYDRLTDLSDVERDILYRHLFVPRNSLQASPAIAGRIIIRLKISPDAAVGERELRLVRRNGQLSNPLRFFVSDTPEFREEFFPFPPAVQKPVMFTIPGNLNGQITPGETDSFTFEAKKGEKIVFKLIGRYLKPFIGDGVPGHFQAIIEVTDKNNRTLACADDYYFDPDPVLGFTAPADGVYTLKIRDALYRGREDFVYRVIAARGSVPLPSAQAPAFAGVPVISAEKAAKDSPVKYPVIIFGTVKEKKGDDYKIALKKDETVVLEIFARRLGLPPDALLKISDENGKMLAFNDDTDRLKAGLILHNSADPQLIFTAPADGIYTVNVSDTAGTCGEAYRYFLRIDRQRPVFAVYSIPSTKLITSASSTPVNLVVERYGQYSGEIKLKVKSPASVRITGIDTIPAGAESAVITLEGDYDRTKPLYDLKIEASAGDFKTGVIPGDEAMQAFAYTHINPARHFPVRVGNRTVAAKWQDEKKTVYTVSPGKSITLKVKSAPIWVNGEPEIKLIAENLPPWLKIVPQKNNPLKVKKVQINQKRTQLYVPPVEIVLQATGEAPGKAVNQIFKLTWEFTAKPDKNGKTRIVRQQITLPAVQIVGVK
ncbi:MAG: PPC domain-containing protein [Lentisphaeria bacterium]|nr:PPC domain-containing protein [Lentisphaeria bacterium]